MKVGQVCNRDVVIVDPEESVIDAAKRMRDYHVGSLVVTREDEGGRTPVGVITDRDIAISVVAAAADRIHILSVQDIMTREPVVAREDEDLDPVIAKMRHEGVRRLVVVDQAGYLQGIIALDDLIEYVADQLDDFVKLISREQEIEADVRP